MCAAALVCGVPFAVGAYITGAYWFTASTFFANPAVTLARSASDTFCWNTARRRSGVYRNATCGCGGGDGAVSLAGAVAAKRCRGRSGFTCFRTEGKNMSDKSKSCRQVQVGLAERRPLICLLAGLVRLELNFRFQLNRRLAGGADTTPRRVGWGREEWVIANRTSWVSVPEISANVS